MFDSIIGHGRSQVLNTMTTTATLNHEQAQEVFDTLIDKVSDPEIATCAYEAARYYGQTKSEIRNGSTIFYTFGYETLRDGCDVDDLHITWSAVKSALQKAGVEIK